jgi:hypothetical protein
MRTRAWLAGLAVAAVVSRAGVAAAAGAEPKDKKRPGRFRVGPVYLTPKLELKNAGVDTNVFNERTGEIPDTSIILTPSVTALWPVSRRLRLTGDGHLDLNYFHREDTERSTDFGAGGRAEVEVGPFVLFGAGGGGQSRQRFSIEFDQRVLRQEKWGAAGATLNVTRRISASGSGSSYVYRYESKIVDGTNIKLSLDRDELTGTGQLRYAMTSRTNLTASADVIEDRFLELTKTASRLSRSYRYMGGFEFGEKALVRGKLMAGVRVFPVSDSAPSYKGPAVATSLSFPLMHYGIGSVIAERDVQFALSPATFQADSHRNTYVSTRLRGEATVNLPLSLIAIGNFGLEQAKFLLPYPAGPVFGTRIDHLWTGGASLLRSFRTGVRLGGTIQWDRRVSSFSSFDYEGLRYGVRAEVVP